jgi:hypothetical protein
MCFPFGAQIRSQKVHGVRLVEMVPIGKNVNEDLPCVRALLSPLLRGAMAVNPPLYMPGLNENYQKSP